MAILLELEKCQFAYHDLFPLVEYTLSWIAIVLAHWNNSPQIAMSPHSDTLFWFRANLSLLFLLNTACLAKKQQIPIWIMCRTQVHSSLSHLYGWLNFKINNKKCWSSNRVINWNIVESGVKHHKPKPKPDQNLWSTTLETSMLTITPPMQLDNQQVFKWLTNSESCVEHRYIVV
jgi:hypothetical protein